FYGKTDIHHVGIYIGDGLMINSPHTGDVVRVSSIWWSDLAGFGRVHAPGTPVPAHNPPTVQKPARPAVVLTAGPVPSQTNAAPRLEAEAGLLHPLEGLSGCVADHHDHHDGSGHHHDHDDRPAHDNDHPWDVVQLHPGDDDDVSDVAALS